MVKRRGNQWNIKSSNKEYCDDVLEKKGLQAQTLGGTALQQTMYVHNAQRRKQGEKVLEL